MKIAVIGGGSTYTPELVDGLMRVRTQLDLTSLDFFDVDVQRLGIVGGFVDRMMARLDPERLVHCLLHKRIETCVEDADFVIVQIRAGGQKARLFDERLGVDHGLLGQETTGVGGLSNALRTIPRVLEIAKFVERLAPRAKLIDFTNPVSIVTQALLEHTKAPVIGLCNIPISQRREIAAHLGVAESSVEIDSVGLNHLSFIRGVRVDGRESLPTLVDGLAGALASGMRPANIPDLDFPPELLRSLGFIPSDYLRYFFLSTETLEEQRSKDKLRAEVVAEIEGELLAHYANPAHATKPESLAKRGGAHYSHAAIEVISAMTQSKPTRLIVNARNGKAVPELPESASIEVPCNVDARGAVPLPQRPLEPEIRGLIQHVKACEELAVTAALSRSWRDVYLAVVTHPLVPSATIAKQVADRICDSLTGKV